MAKTTIEIDVNTGDSAKSLSELKGEFRDLQNTLENLTPDTKEYIDTLKKLGSVKNDIEDVKKEVLGFADGTSKLSALSGTISGIVSGFEAASGAAALFGMDNENLEKQIKNLQAVMSFSEGVKGVLEVGDSFKVLSNAIKSTEIGSKAAAVAQRVWNAAVNAFGGPIGAIIVALTALVGVIALVVNAMGDEDEAQKEVIKNREKELELMQEADKAFAKEAEFRKNLAAAQGKSAQEQLALNEELSKQRIKQIDAEIQTQKKLINERLARARNADEEERNDLYKANAATLKLMKDLADERLSIQRNLQIESTKLETETNKAAADKSKEKQQKDKENADKKRQKDLEDAEKWRQEQAKFIQYEIDALNNKFGEEEQIIAEQQLATKIALGIATPEEIDAWDAMRLQKQKEYNAEVDAELKRLKDLQDKSKKEEEEAAKKAKEARQAEINANFKMTSDAIGALIELNNSYPATAEKNAKRSFQINKALQLAQATVNGVQAVQNVLADPTLVGPARYVAAAIAGVTALANINKIAQTKFETSSTSAPSGGGGNLGTFTQGGGGGQPPQGLTAQNTVTQLNPDGTVAGQGQRQAAPMKAYVVESESRAVTERVNKLSNNSKIG